jgi:pimeloyl-ACP methyl ester carboxylesterase
MLTAVMRSTHSAIVPNHAPGRPAPRRRLRCLWTTILLCQALLGCSTAAQAQQPAVTSDTAAPTTAQAQPRRYVLHLPGIGGAMRIDRNLVAGLRQGGLDAADIETYDWTGTDRGIVALGQQQRHQAESQRIADIITARFRASPTTPITLTGHSAGCGMAVWALEKLPDDVQVDTLLMMQSALSPRYDLSKALRHVRGRAYSFYSPLDPVLGPGTKLLGTVDRVFTEAAGRAGYQMPDGADADQYRKLEQIAYDDVWLRFDNIGDHIGPMTRSFASHMLAPLLTNGALPKLPALPTSQPTTATTP